MQELDVFEFMTVSTGWYSISEVFIGSICSYEKQNPLQLFV